MFRSAPVALRWTRMSFERANRVRGTRAPDLAILVLLSSAQNGGGSEVRGKRHRQPSLTMRSQIRHTTHCVALYLNVGTEHLPDERLKTAKLHDEQLVVGCRAASASKPA